MATIQRASAPDHRRSAYRAVAHDLRSLPAVSLVGCQPRRICTSVDHPSASRYRVRLSPPALKVGTVKVCGPVRPARRVSSPLHTATGMPPRSSLRSTLQQRPPPWTLAAGCSRAVVHSMEHPASAPLRVLLRCYTDGMHAESQRAGARRSAQVMRCRLLAAVNIPSRRGGTVLAAKRREHCSSWKRTGQTSNLGTAREQQQLDWRLPYLATPPLLRHHGAWDSSQLPTHAATAAHHATSQLPTHTYTLSCQDRLSDRAAADTGICRARVDGVPHEAHERPQGTTAPRPA
jgi:hypothetical protein